MSYYITALPQYHSLSKCAQSGIESVVLGVTIPAFGVLPLANWVTAKLLAVR